MSEYVPIRLKADELIKLDSIKDSETGFENRGEVFRYLLLVEYNRRHNKPRPKAADWQTAFRGVKKEGVVQ